MARPLIDEVLDDNNSLIHKKTALVFLVTLASTACGAIYSKFQSSGVSTGETSDRINQNILKVSNSIEEKRKQITNENLLYSEFMEDSGARDFNNHGVSAGLSYVTRSWDDYLDMCRSINATLATPKTFEDFLAISTVASKHGHCYVGIKRNVNQEWKSPDNQPVYLSPTYWAKNQPSSAPDFLCAYILNSGENSFLYSTSCGGDNPAIKCFICQKTP